MRNSIWTELIKHLWDIVRKNTTCNEEDLLPLLKARKPDEKILQEKTNKAALLHETIVSVHCYNLNYSYLKVSGEITVLKMHKRTVCYKVKWTGTPCLYLLHPHTLCHSLWAILMPCNDFRNRNWSHSMCEGENGLMQPHFNQQRTKTITQTGECGVSHKPHYLS